MIQVDIRVLFVFYYLIELNVLIKTIQPNENLKIKEHFFIDNLI